MKQYLLSIDNGGTYIKAAVFDRKGKQAGTVRRHNRALEPQPGWLEYDLEELWRANCFCMKEALQKTGIAPEEIVAVGIAGQGSGFYGVDAGGKPVRNAISSADRRAYSQAERWKQDGTGKRLYPYIYRETFPGHTNAILAWLKENEPENYFRIHRLFAMNDYLVYKLTGNAVSGYGCLSASGLMNMRTKAFDPMLAECFGIPEMADKFGPSCWDIEVCGTVTEAAAESCGCIPGTPVSGGLHDVSAAALAMGITDSERCFLITGTHGINGYVSEKPVLDGTVRYNELFAFPGKFLLEEGYPSSSGTLEWVLSVLYADEEKLLSNEDGTGREELYQRVNEEVEQVPPQESELVFLPYLRGSRDNGRAAGTWIGLRPEHTRAHMLRAVYEGVVFGHVLQMEAMFAKRERLPGIRLAGGAVHSPVWVQMFADAFGISMEVIPGGETGARGAAIAAAAAAGLYPDIYAAVEQMAGEENVLVVIPRPEYTKVYRKKLTRFRRLAQALEECWGEFSK